MRGAEASGRDSRPPPPPPPPSPSPPSLCTCPKGLVSRRCLVGRRHRPARLATSWAGRCAITSAPASTSLTRRPMRTSSAMRTTIASSSAPQLVLISPNRAVQAFLCTSRYTKVVRYCASLATGSSTLAFAALPVRRTTTAGGGTRRRAHRPRADAAHRRRVIAAPRPQTAGRPPRLPNRIAAV